MSDQVKTPLADMPCASTEFAVPSGSDSVAEALFGDGRLGVIDGRAVANSLAPRWDDNGEPITLSAAACDALDWLEWMRGYLTANKTTRLDQTRANLARCAIMLRAKIEQTISADVQNRGSLETDAGARETLGECTSADSFCNPNVTAQTRRAEPPK